jgi:hypothetical protein
MNILQHYEIIGLLGLLIESIAIYLLRIGKIQPQSLLFIIMVTTGSCACIYTTYYAWNLICFTVNFFWLVYNIYCFFKYYILK